MIIARLLHKPLKIHSEDWGRKGNIKEIKKADTILHSS